ncbi:hypothetical protein D3C85_1585520 [compost metagenome]
MLVLQSLCSLLHALLKLAIQLQQCALVFLDLRCHAKEMLRKLMQLRRRSTRYDLQVRLGERSTS